MRYSIIHDAVWVTFLYGLFISLTQFKYFKFDSSLAVINLVLAIIFSIAYIIFVIIMINLGYRFRKVQNDKIPKKFSFLRLEPSVFPLEMPIRYIRKTLLVFALLMTGFESQVVMMLMINLTFFFYFLCFKPAESMITNGINLTIEVFYIVLESLFFAYYKLEVKDITNQKGFSYAMVALQSVMILIIIGWIVYRLILVIRQTETWKKCYLKLTQNTDPSYLKEEQRKRDLDFDFGSLENRSQDDITEQPIRKPLRKGGRKVKETEENFQEKFNIFDQANQIDEIKYIPPANQKKHSRKASRPSSVDSSDKIDLSSNSDDRALFEASKTAKEFRKKDYHLKIQNQNDDSDIEEIIIRQDSDISSNKGFKLQEKKAENKVLWDQIEFDENEI